ncbi:uncharacterized protein BXZ73DRAFT_103174 [Epithele typhae]|uniref:uncharacterized protein n=1 Tax=Epithele typhae TaxID=378194 RepID=UPI002008B68A|nr:uncharacterized protein BXZ73DRAFT_103174 [Epithele typhae]KAH9925639.1 hypothetical protein BXZ73DRAFT_103174 [Epithele typhae]
MSTESFIQAFLNDPNFPAHHRVPPAMNPFMGLMRATSMREDNIGAKFTSAINSANLVLGLTMATSEKKVDEANLPDVNDPNKQKIDGALYPSDHTPTDSRPHWADQVVPIDVMATPAPRKKILGQIAHHVDSVLLDQHRTFLFFIFVFGRKIRFTRWDYSGVVITPLFDYYQQWETTCNILRRIAFLACHGRGEGVGFDPTAERLREGHDLFTKMTEVATPKPTDVDHTERKLKDDELLEGDITFTYVRDRFRESIRTGPRYALSVPDENGGHRIILVGRAEFAAGGATGRFTRGYIGYDTKTGLFVWLKDTWRPDYIIGLAKEGDTLKALHAANVTNIPTLVCHGDIGEQVTRTHDFWTKRRDEELNDIVDGVPEAQKSGPRNAGKRKLEDLNTSQGVPPDADGDPDFKSSCLLRRHRHYRLCVKEVGLPLESFTSPRQFVRIVLDAGAAHRDAYHKGDTLHRDISGGNIIIYPRVRIVKSHFLAWVGLLTDWELAKTTDALKLWTRPGRTGTAQFMSVAMLEGNGKVSELSDDLESFFYVILYYLVRFVESDLGTAENVFLWLEHFFDCYAVEGGMHTCGAAKKNASFRAGRLSRRNSFGFGTPLDMLIDDLHTSLRDFYYVKRWNEQQRKANEPVSGPMVAEPVVPSSRASSPPPDDLEEAFHVNRAGLPADLWRSAGETLQSCDDDALGPTSEQEDSALVFQNSDRFLAVLQTCVRLPAKHWARCNEPATDQLLEQFDSTQPVEASLKVAARPRTRRATPPVGDGESPLSRPTKKARTSLLDTPKARSAPDM